MKTIKYIIPLILLCGCGAIVPKESTNEKTLQANIALQNSQAGEITKQVEASQPPINISGSSNSLSLTILPTKTSIAETNAAESSTVAKDDFVSKVKSSIPMFVKLIGFAFGIALLFGVIAGIIWYVKRSSAAGAAAITLADNSIASLIHKHTTLAMTTTDPVVIAQNTATIAELEKQRGVLNSK